MIKVLANLCSMVPGQVGGSEVYASRLLAAFASLGVGETSDISVEVASMANTRTTHPCLEGFRWHESRWRGDLRPLRVAVESTWLAARSNGFDVVHHFGGRLPAVRRGMTVLTIHDTQPLDVATNFSMLKRNYLRWALPRSAASASLLAVPSKWVATRLQERLSVPASRIAVVPSSYRLKPAEAPNAELPNDEGEALPLDILDSLSGHRFVLYPAATYPHKNHSMLINAHAAVWARHGEPMLVLTGAAGRSHASVADHAARTPGVLHLGWVNETRLAALIDSAVAVAFPSRYEGFGLPVLEAMMAGTPVIASTATALPEVVGNGGLLIDPDDLDGWIDALLEVRQGSADVSKRVEQGHVRAADFAPEHAAVRLIDAWKKAALSDRDECGT